MTQAQRKKALVEAQELVRTLTEEVARNEPLTATMKAALCTIFECGGEVWVHASGIWWGNKTAGCDKKGPRVTSQSLWGLELRRMVIEHSHGVQPKGMKKALVYTLSDWGKEVAGALAKASKPASEE